MDKKIQKKNKTPKMILFSLLGFSLLAVVYWLSFSGAKSVSINSDELSIREVKQGTFEDVLIVQGSVKPGQTVLLNAIEGGAVREKFVENGAMVTKGQTLCVLNNPSTELNFLTQETGIVENINQLRTSIINLRNQTLEDDKEIILIENEYNLAKEQYENDKRLFESEIIPRSQYVISKENFEYQVKRKRVIANSITRERGARNEQIQQMNNTIGQQQRSLEVLKRNKGNFVLKAIATGRLSNFDLNIGQFVQSGEQVGAIDLMQSYKMELLIDEYHLGKMGLGTEGTLEDNDKNYELVISKILPEVKNGRFTAEMLFKNKAPENLKIGQNFTIKLEFSKHQGTKTLLSKGSFYSVTGGKWVFVLKGNKAQKRNIELGRENHVYYEVLSGLEKGEKVIVSDYENLGKYEEINVKN